MKRFVSKLGMILPGLMLLCSFSFSAVSYAASSPSATDNSGTCGSVKGSPTDDVLQGVTQTASSTDKVDCSGTGVTSIVSTVVNILSYVVGILAIIMIIIAGFKYITAGGDSNQVSSAKSTLIYAIVGLVIAALAQVIVHEVLNTAASATPH